MLSRRLLKHFSFNSAILIVFLSSLVKSDNTCLFEKLEWPVQPVSKIILRFECYSGTDSNPTISIENGSQPSEFNEIDLSPNLYFTLPLAQLCLFRNVYLLDLSYNSLTSLQGAFSSLSCMTSLSQLDLSNNLISSPILASDFNDQFAANIQSLDLSTNQIPSIDSSAFFKSDGTSRFPKLSSLDLGKNLIKQLDLLWPLSLPSPTLRVVLSENRIDTLVNQLGRSFADPRYVAMSGAFRTLDASENPLNTLSDSNLLGYQLNSASDFKSFLEKIANYNFTQTINRFVCSCPPGGLFTVSWYQSFSSTIVSKSSPIYNLGCSDIPYKLFEYPCQVS